MPRLFGMSKLELRTLEKVYYSSGVLTIVRALVNLEQEVCGRLLGYVHNSTLHIEKLEIVDGYSSTNAFRVDISNFVIPKPDSSRLVGLIHTHPGYYIKISKIDTYYASLSPFLWAIAGREKGELVIRHYVPNFGGVREIAAVKF